MTDQGPQSGQAEPAEARRPAPVHGGRDALLRGEDAPEVGGPEPALDPKGNPLPSRPGQRFSVLPSTGEIVDPVREYRREAYRLREASRRLLDYAEFRGLHQCGLPVTGEGGSVRVVVHPVSGRAHWSGVLHCGSPWVCPVCARKISARRGEDIEGAVAEWLAGGGQVFFATLTVPHLRRYALEWLLEGFSRARRRLWSHRRWREWKFRHIVPGVISAFEITYGLNGWHPHLHVLIFVAGDPATPEDLHEVLWSIWSDAVLAAGLGEASPEALHVVEVGPREAGAIAAYTAGGSGKHWGIGAEMAGQVVKRGGLSPFELLAVAAGRRVLDWLPQERAVALWREYARATRGRRHLVWSPGLAEVLGLRSVSDEELANAEGDGEEVLKISARDYAVLRRLGYLAEPLELVEDYGPEVALTWIRQVVGGRSPPDPAAKSSERDFADSDAFLRAAWG